MSNQTAEIFLGKHGKIYGPFSSREFERFHDTGKIYEYNWLWEKHSAEWKLLDPAPSHPPPRSNAPAKSLEKSIEKKSKSSKHVQTKKATAGKSEIQAIVHNSQSLISGTLQFWTETGCEILSQASHSSQAIPCLAKGSMVNLSLLETQTGRSMNLQASVSDISYHKNNWIYRIRWKARPALL